MLLFNLVIPLLGIHHSKKKYYNILKTFWIRMFITVLFRLSKILKARNNLSPNDIIKLVINKAYDYISWNP